MNQDDSQVKNGSPTVLPDPTISQNRLSQDPSRVYNPGASNMDNVGGEQSPHPESVQGDLDARTFSVSRQDTAEDSPPLMNIGDAIDSELNAYEAPTPFSPVAAKLVDNPEAPDAIFTPEEEPKSEDDVNWENILSDAYREVDDRGYTNLDKAPTAVPLGTITEMNDALMAEVSRNPNDAVANIRDMNTDVNILDRARGEHTLARGLLSKGLERIQGDNLDESLQQSIVHAYDGKKIRIQDSAANVSAINKGKTRVNLNIDKDSSVTISALTGANIRKYYLYSSGISINIRRVHLREFSEYARSITESDSEYGKQFGGFYYLYSDLHITKYVIENLLPLAICGSSFNEWRDFNKLVKVISHQDYHTILWAIAQTMHPKGVEVGYACGNPDCGHVTRETVDLFKLRYQNVNLLNDDMRNFIVAKQEVGVTDLDEYRKSMRMSRAIETTIGSDRRMVVNLRQASLADYIQVGTEFYTDLEAVCNTANVEEVNNYLTYNVYKAYRPWIESMVIYDGETEYVLENDGSRDSITGMNSLLDELQLYAPDFGDKIAEYILDTKISHVAFHVNTCSKCGTLPTSGRDGFIPYDPQYNFFTLALSLLHRVQ